MTVHHGPLYEAQLLRIADPLMLRTEIPPEIMYLDNKLVQYTFVTTPGFTCEILGSSVSFH